jgi:transcriptional regulator with GAF, ATPase, and Fis domain
LLSFIILLSLFSFLFFLGIVNLWFPQHPFLEKNNFLYFGNAIIAFFYLIFLSIFFIVFSSIMIKIILSEFSIKEKKEIRKLQEEAVIEKEIIIKENEKKEQQESENKSFSVDDNQRINEYDIDEIYMRFSTMIEDIVQSVTYTEVFEKLIFWGSELTFSKKCSIMLYNKNNDLYIYKIKGWDQTEKIKFKELVLDTQNICYQAAESKKRLFVENIDNFNGYNFKFSNQYQSKSFVSYPILVNSNVIGVVNFTDHKNSVYRIYNLEAAGVMIRVASLTLELIQLMKKNNKLEE